MSAAAERAPYGAAAGAVGVVLFAIGSALTGDRPGFDASGADVAAHLAEERTRIQVGCALLALATAFLVWFVATVKSLAAAGGPTSRRAGTVGLACGLVFLTLFLADVTTLAVSALRPENMASDPELAAALRDFEFLAMGMAAFVASGMLLAFAVPALGDGAFWPRWVGTLAAVAAPLYALRVGTLFTTEGAFAADGLLGLYVPVAAIAVWVLVASVALARR